MINWYYAADGKQAGPVSEQDLASMVNGGQISLDTLVWREGMANWQPVREVQASIPGLAAPAGATLAATGAGISGDVVVCQECQKTVPKAETIQYGDGYVCAACKPAFFQKVREGVTPGTLGAVRYAGFWIRFGAKFLDNIITSIVSLPLTLGLGVASQQPNSFGEIAAIQSLSMGLGLLIGLAYTTFFLGKYGATPGKMAVKIKVVGADGSKLTYGRAAGRFFAEILSGCPTLMIGYIMAAFDQEKRALHDRICGTRVIYK